MGLIFDAGPSMIPPAFVHDLLTRVDIVELVSQQLSLKKAGVHHKGLCPFHTEKTPSFTVSASRQTYHCFGCGAHGNALGFLMAHHGLGFVEAVRDLAQQAGLTVPEDHRSDQERARDQAQKQRKTSISDVLSKAAEHYRVQLKASLPATQYLKVRGLSDEIAIQFGLGYAREAWRGLASAFDSYDDSLLEESGLVIAKSDPAEPQDGASAPEAKRYDRFRDRIMFPIRSVQGDVIGFGGRVLGRGEPKYLNSPETPVFIKGHELYGLFEARPALRKRGFALVVEGYMDVVALAQWGFPNVVATLGTACTAEHVQKLFRFTDSVVFSFDGDAAGRRAADRALEASLPYASDTRSIRFLFLPAEHDPDSYVRELGADAFEAQIEQAAPLSRQLIDTASKECDLESAEGRARLLANARPLWQTLPQQGGLRAQLLEELASLARLPSDDVLALWEAQLRSKRRSTAGAALQVPLQPPSAARWARRATQGATTLLDRVVWLLLHDCDAWSRLSAEQQLLLCEQASPHGQACACIERQLHEEGPVTADALLPHLSHPDLGPHATEFAQRIHTLLPPASDCAVDQELKVLLSRLQLQSVERELKALFEMGVLTDDARQRSRQLLELQTRLKQVSQAA
jgi:DNA primase